MDREALLLELQKTRQLCHCFEDIIENLPDTIYVTDAQARTMRVNKAYEELSGLKREEILGLHMGDMEKQYISQSGSLQVLKTGQEANIELVFQRTNRHAFICSKPIYDENGNLEMIISNSRNFEEIQRLEERLAAAEQLADKYQAEIRALKEQFLPPAIDMVAEDKKMLDVLTRAYKVAKVDSTTLILGETGVGKEEVAKYIHENSPRAKQRFVKVNCGALSENLIESELFGYEKGAFTGASKTGKMGLFEVANHGTIFLDEIGELPLDMQVKLLRVLQDQQVTRIGGTEPVKIDVRILAATNRDLLDMVEHKQFRQDLYYRLSAFSVELPPLRSCPEDICFLIDRLMEKIPQKYGVPPKSLSGEAFDKLLSYNWPGNIRELENVLERAVALSESELIYAEHICVESQPVQLTLRERLKQEEKRILRQTLAQCGGSRSQAMKLLGLSKTVFYGKLKEYQIS